MKIFNNFDTKLKKREYEEAMKLYWKNKVILVQRHKSFWIIKGLIPLSIIIIANILIFIFIWKIEIELLKIVVFLVLIGDIIYLYNLFNLFLDYKFDYTLITPDRIITYKQKWILNSKLKDLPASQIKSTQSYRSGILWNIFSFGNIEILTDWAVWADNFDGSSQAWKTKLTYVHHPTAVKKEIMKITNITTNQEEQCA